MLAGFHIVDSLVVERQLEQLVVERRKFGKTGPMPGLADEPQVECNSEPVERKLGPVERVAEREPGLEFAVVDKHVLEFAVVDTLEPGFVVVDKLGLEWLSVESKWGLELAERKLEPVPVDCRWEPSSDKPDFGQEQQAPD